MVSVAVGWLCIALVTRRRGDALWAGSASPLVTRRQGDALGCFLSGDVSGAWPRQAETPSTRVKNVTSSAVVNMVTGPVSLGKEPRPKGPDVLLESVLVSSGLSLRRWEGARGSVCPVELPPFVWRDLEIAVSLPFPVRWATWGRHGFSVAWGPGVLTWRRG